MAKHVQILGILHIVLSGLGFLAAFIVLLVMGGVAGLIGAAADPSAHIAIPIVGGIGVLVFLGLLLISTPGLIAGIGLLRYREWARILTIVLSALELPGVPFGTALGVYGLWVLLNNQTVQLFARPPAQQFSAYR